MSIREDRVSRRIRNFIKLPTEIMMADGMTKVKLCYVLMDFLTNGYWVILRRVTSPIFIKSSPSLTMDDADEYKLTNLSD